MSQLTTQRDPRTAAVTEIRCCRICGNTELDPVIDLGRQAVASLFDDGRPENRLDQRIPLQVVQCRGGTAAQPACGFVQLRHTVSPEILYRD
jgi:NDP-4-keto-2,6-dideoxyhexose 3-C-methyltransferase